MVVVEQPDVLCFEHFAYSVQALCQFLNCRFIGIIETIHPCDDDFIRPETFSLLHYCIELPFQRAEIGVQADD